MPVLVVLAQTRVVPADPHQASDRADPEAIHLHDLKYRAIRLDIPDLEFKHA